MARFSAVRGRGRGWLLLSVALGWFVVLGLRFVVPALLPQIKGDFGISNGTAGVAVTLIWATYALAQFPAGELVDRVGARRLLAAGLGFAGLGFAIFALSPVFVIFVVGCMVFGLGSGIVGPSRGVVLSSDLLLSVNGEASHGTAPLGWDICWFTTRRHDGSLAGPHRRYSYPRMGTRSYLLSRHDSGSRVCLERARSRSPDIVASLRRELALLSAQFPAHYRETCGELDAVWRYEVETADNSQV